MKVVILCGGRGTRLAGDHSVVPKPLVEVGGKPLLWHIMKGYASYGYTDFVLCLGYKGDMIKQYFLNYDLYQNDLTLTLGARDHLVIHRAHAEDGWRIAFVDTGLDAMTGARVKRIERYVDTPEFMLTYGDGVADINLQDLVAFHRAHGKLATVTGVRPKSRFGELIVEGTRVAEFSEKPQVHEGYINGGFFVFKRGLFQRLSLKDDQLIFEREPLEELARNGELMVYKHTGSWLCVDTPRDLQILNEHWQHRPFWKSWDNNKGQST